ncbi:MAG: tryptophan synthase subunit alpha [Polyangiaceae bacterium]
MSARLRGAFARAKARGGPTLAAYVMVGDPSWSASVDAALACVDAGAGIIELGAPFSDPIADGPTIARAGARALERGTRLEDVFAAAAAIRARTDAPLVVMGYANPIHRHGLERFASSASRAGVDGVLVPDLPFDHAVELRAALAPRAIALPHLVAPTTTPERMRAIVRAASGFVYLVSATGVTGAARPVLDEVRANVAALKQHTDLPVLAGFGLRSPEQLAALASASPPDGVVVGSAIVELAGADHPSEAARITAVSHLVRALVCALEPKECSPC